MTHNSPAKQHQPPETFDDEHLEVEPESFPRDQSIPVYVLMLAPAMVVAYLFARGGTTPAQMITWSGLTVVCAGLFALGLMSGRSALLDIATVRLGPLYAASLVLVYGLTTIRLRDAEEGLFPVQIELLQGPGIVAAVPSLVWIVLVVAVAYRGFPGVLSRRLSVGMARFGGPANSAYSVRLFMLAIAACADLAAWRLGLLGYVTDARQALASASLVANGLSLLGTLKSFVLFWTAWRWSRTRDASELTLLIAATSVFLSMGLLSGMKEAIITPVLMAFLGIAASKGRIPWTKLLLAIAVYVVVVTPVSDQYKSWVELGNGERRTSTEVVGNLGDLLDHLEIEPTEAPDYLGKASLRITRILDYSSIHQLTPDFIPYRPVSEFAAGFGLGFVPRAVWPGKPILSKGYDFAVEYYGQGTSIASASAVTPEGDLWRHGGLLIVTLGAGLLGFFYRFIDSLSQASRDPRYYFIGLFFLPTTLKHELDLVSVLASVPLGLTIGLLAIRMSREPRTTTR